MGQKYKNEDLIELAKQLYKEVGRFDEPTFCKRCGIKRSVLKNHFTIRLKSESDHRRYIFAGYNYQIDDDNLDFKTQDKLKGDYWSNFMTLADIPPYARSKESVIEDALRKIPKDGSRLTPLDWNDSLAPIIRHFGNLWNAFVNEVERAKKEKDTESVTEEKKISDGSPEEGSFDNLMNEIWDLKARFEQRFPGLVFDFNISNRKPPLARA